MSKVFVGNLNYQATEHSLKNLCDECGVAVGEIKIVSDRHTGRSRGFGFIELAEGQDLDDAIAVLNGKVLEGRPLRVDRANEPSPRSGPGDTGKRRW